jgi:hypothetical protein
MQVGFTFDGKANLMLTDSHLQKWIDRPFSASFMTLKLSAVKFWGPHEFQTQPI